MLTVRSEIGPYPRRSQRKLGLPKDNVHVRTKEPSEAAPQTGEI